jgi:hypothetical protein
MTSKQKTGKGAPSSARTLRQWEESAFCHIGLHANFEAKMILVAARRFGIDVSEGFIAEHWHALLSAMENAKAAWLAGDDRRAAQFAALVGIMAGIMARDNDAVFNAYRAKQQRTAKRPRRPKEIDSIVRRIAEQRGTAIDLWKRLIAALDQDGYIVCESVTKAGTLSLEIDGSDLAKPRRLSRKTFDNIRSESR